MYLKIINKAVKQIDENKLVLQNKRIFLKILKENGIYIKEHLKFYSNITNK